MNRKTLISHVVALVLGALSGWLGHDFRWLQAPVENAANVAVDAAAKAAVSAPAADAGAPAAPAPAPAPAPAADAGVPSAPAADAGH